MEKLGYSEIFINFIKKFIKTPNRSYPTMVTYLVPSNSQEEYNKVALCSSPCTLFMAKS